jgi:hypothetical protein
MISNESLGSKIVNVFSDGTIMMIHFPYAYSRENLVYTCQECYEMLTQAVDENGEFLQHIDSGRSVVNSSNFEYYDLSCDGSQINRWWRCSDDACEDLPWLAFRQKLLDVMNETVTNGQVISDTEYLQRLSEMEEKYDFASLTDSNWTDWWMR